MFFSVQPDRDAIKKMETPAVAWMTAEWPLQLSLSLSAQDCACIPGLVIEDYFSSDSSSRIVANFLLTFRGIKLSTASCLIEKLDTVL